MSSDKKILYSVSLATLVSLLVTLFIESNSGRILAAILLIPLAAAAWFLIKKRSILSISKREVLLVLSAIGAIYVILLHMSGLYFGYVKNPYFIRFEILWKFLLPISVIIITVEIIRSVLLAQNNKIVDIIAYFSCVFAEVLTFSNLYGITTFNRFMDLVGMTIFPAISANLLYHFVSKRFGMFPNIAYRAIITLYVYFVPTVSAISDSLSSAIKLVLPLVILSALSALYDKKKKFAKEKKSKFTFVWTSFAVLVIISTVMLISCQFRFGALVIATDSMTGEINKGDVIIFEEKRDQILSEGQIIVFEKDGSRTVHRIAEIERINGVTRYYTKGDANEDLDAGFITEANIIGVAHFKIAYIGFPTIWLRSLFGQ